MTVRIEEIGQKIRVHSPYHPQFPSAARALGGRWDAEGKTWVFDIRDIDRVRETLRGIYGTDGSAEGATVTLHVNVNVLQRLAMFDSALNQQLRSGSLFIAGREIARRPHRDAPVRLGEGVTIISGGFPATGGSVKHPELGPREGTVVEVRDVPVSAASAAVDQFPAAVSIVGEQEAHHQALLAEKERLLARLAEIDAELGAVVS